MRLIGLIMLTLVLVAIGGGVSYAKLPGSDSITIEGITPLQIAVADTSADPIVAMTWKLDGVPIGTSSVPESVSNGVSTYVFDVNAALLPAGVHQLVVEGVRESGSRFDTFPVTATVGAGPTPTGTNPSASHAIVHLSGTQGGFTVGPDTTVYGSGGSTVIDGDVTLSSGSRLQDLIVDGAVIATNTTGALVQSVTIDSNGSTGVVLGDSPDFALEQSVLNGPSSTGNVIGVSNGNYEQSGQNTIFSNDVIRNFGGDGISFIASDYDNTLAASHLLVLDNHISGANGPSDNGTQARGAILGGDYGNVIGNTVVGGSTASLEAFRSAMNMHWEDNTVSGSKTGIYIEHFGDDSDFGYNTISATGAGIDIEWVADSDPPRSTVDVHIHNNAFNAPVGVFADAGSREIETGPDNLFDGSLPAVVYQGSIDGSIYGNRACTAQSGPFASVYANDGYNPAGNVTVEDNTVTGPC